MLSNSIYRNLHYKKPCISLYSVLTYHIWPLFPTNMSDFTGILYNGLMILFYINGKYISTTYPHHIWILCSTVDMNSAGPSLSISHTIPLYFYILSNNTVISELIFNGCLIPLICDLHDTHMVPFSYQFL